MDSIAFKSYVKNNEIQEEVYRKNTRKRVIIITISTIVLITVIAAAIVGTLTQNHKTNPIQTPSSPANDDVSESIKTMCNVTLYPDSCYSSMSEDLKTTSTNPTTNPQQLFKISLKIALNELVNLSSSLSRIFDKDMLDCLSLVQDSVDHVNMSIISTQSFSETMVNDIRTWLSTAITDQQTCLDGFEEVGNMSIREEVRVAMKNSTEFTSNSLAIITNIHSIFSDFRIPEKGKLLEAEKEVVVVEANVTVAKDGSGDFESIAEAVNGVPRKSKGMYVIYVKKGVYKENVVVGKDMWNVMMYGDGMNNTIVSGSLNNAGGVSTYKSGTFIAEGRGFIAKDMGFINTAGPGGEQAVALRSSSDKSIFFRCSFDAYQDTLYAHSNRQFYRECLITGTVDFIFGNAAVVIQNSTIQPRQPGPKQYNTITAQGKTDRNQNTGISIQRCKISPFDNVTALNYLGRPWKNYSTTIFMESNIGGLISPAGWIQWAPNVDPPNTIFYAEYNNTGHGSGLDRRVDWAVYEPNVTSKEASKFTVDSFIQGREWLPRAIVPYDAT